MTMYYHVKGEVILVIEADDAESAREQAEEWAHETVFDFRITGVE